MAGLQSVMEFAPLYSLAKRLCTQDPCGGTWGGGGGGGVEAAGGGSELLCFQHDVSISLASRSPMLHIRACVRSHSLSSVST